MRARTSRLVCFQNRVGAPFGRRAYRRVLAGGEWITRRCISIESAGTEAGQVKEWIRQSSSLRSHSPMRCNGDWHHRRQLGVFSTPCGRFQLSTRADFSDELVLVDYRAFARSLGRATGLTR